MQAIKQNHKPTEIIEVVYDGGDEDLYIINPNTIYDGGGEDVEEDN